MTDEMLQEEVTEIQDEVEQVDDSQEVAESEEIAPPKDDFVELNPEQQKKFNKLTWEKNEAIRKAKALEERLAQSASTPAPQQEEVSDFRAPDPDLAYSDPEKYASELSAWQRQVREEAKREAVEAAKSVLNETKTKAEQEAQTAKQQELINQYADRAIKSGINAQKLIDAEQVFTAYNPQPELVDFILSDNDGPHLMNYLVDHQAELETLVTLPPMRAALHLEKLRDKARNATVRTKAPDPVQPLGGRSTVENESPLLKGVIFS